MNFDDRGPGTEKGEGVWGEDGVVVGAECPSVFLEASVSRRRSHGELRQEERRSGYLLIRSPFLPLPPLLLYVRTIPKVTGP